MAKGLKTGGRDFTPGNSGGPGRPTGSDDIKRIRKLTKVQMKTMGDAILGGNLEGLKEIQKDPDSTVLQIWISSVVTKAINRGDMSSLNTLLDRLIGKVKEDIAIQLAVPTIIKRLDGSTVEYGSKLIGSDEDEED